MWYLLVIICILSFLGLFFAYKKFGMSAIYCFAIGGIVNSNFFHAQSYPLMLGSFQFGFDSVIYTVFVFCVLIAFYRHSKKEAMTLTYSSMGAVLLSAIVQFFADWSRAGKINFDILTNFGGFIASILGTYLAVVLMLMVCERLRSKNISVYLGIALGIFLASVVNSLIYYGVIALMGVSFASNFGMILASSYIGKFVSIAFSILIYYLLGLKTSKKTKKIEN